MIKSTEQLEALISEKINLQVDIFVGVKDLIVIINPSFITRIKHKIVGNRKLSKRINDLCYKHIPTTITENFKIKIFYTYG